MITPDILKSVYQSSYPYPGTDSDNPGKQYLALWENTRAQYQASLYGEPQK